MHNATTKYKDQTAADRAQDAKLLKESGVHKLVVLDHQGNCLAYLLAWDSFGYDAETDTYVCIAEPDGGELMTIHTDGDVKADPATNTYTVTAPNAEASPETGYCTVGVAS
ncbi:MAG: hypothetical protein ACRDTS_18120 [Mycobacterium sp.]